MGGDTGGKTARVHPLLICTRVRASFATAHRERRTEEPIDEVPKAWNMGIPWQANVAPTVSA